MHKDLPNENNWATYYHPLTMHLQNISLRA
jgi:hypothetical protein